MDKWRRIEMIGQGTFGSVFLLQDPKHPHMHGAVKVMTRNWSDSPQGAHRAVMEFQVGHYLRHPNLLHLDADRIDKTGRLSFYSPLMDASLDDMLTANHRTPVTLPHVAWILYQMLGGLECLHAAGIAHRDLKPANVLINKDCTVRICDFGMARKMTDITTTEVTKTDTTDVEPITSTPMTMHVTTRWYRAPEVLLYEPYTTAIDIWAVGCIMAELMHLLPRRSGERHAVTRFEQTLFPGRSCHMFSPSPQVESRDSEQFRLIWKRLGWRAFDWYQGHELPMTRTSECDPQGFEDLITPIDSAACGEIDSCTCDNALQLLTALLTANPNTRLTATQARAHPFFSKFATTLVVPHVITHDDACRCHVCIEAASLSLTDTLQFFTPDG